MHALDRGCPGKAFQDQDTEAETDQALAAGRDPGSIGREIGCALVMGSIASIAANIPPALLFRLIEEGVWPPSRALAYALATPDPAAAGRRRYGGLAPHLPPTNAARRRPGRWKPPPSG